jgi:hypothetical protein
MTKVAVTFKAEVSRIYFRRVEAQINTAVSDAMDLTIQVGVKTAKQHCPVRKVTKKGGRVSTRDLDDAEIAALPDFVKKGLNPATNTYIRTGKRPQQVVKRSLAGYEEPQFRHKGRKGSYPQGIRQVTQDEDTGRYSLATRMAGLRPGQLERAVLTSRGRYELRTGRGVFARGGELHLGGRLKREIHGEMEEGVFRQSGILRAKLVSPTEYAPYVEFPTSRTAAQPYMRPARDAMEAVFERNVRSALERITG